ncbi:alpha/beta fold hydrolase [Aerosakkonema funiforme]|uniref:Alpha/beta hydrolase n=1 Tax=Aerosakkonema funiforme FACHB-1375 TaxID=2949571 RepID=A0A926ZJ29_9CYAN|nr:alpha/beta hydrolase [Aerosakkonema funiforme]MBD2185123.1 alpha/beta hydrolase [Aerosakkonema funiforme FACHB-1375]
MQDWWQSTFPKGRQTLTIADARGYPVKIAYGEKGTGKPLFLVHGIGSWSYGWHHNIEELAKHFRVICFDAKGHGFSDKPHYSEELGHQIVEMGRIIRALCDEPAVVVAQSLGALIALAIAEENPDLLARLVLINVPVFPTQLPSLWMRLLAILPLDLVRSIDSLRLSYWLAPILRQIVAIGRREVVVDPAEITPEKVYWVSYPYIEFPNTVMKVTEDLQHAAVEIERSLKNEPNIIHNIQDNLLKVTCPVLILWGEQDQWFPAENAKKLQARLPNARLKIIPNCGHDAAAGSPEVVNSEILEFLRDSEYVSL